MLEVNSDSLDWSKCAGLLPAIVQDAKTQQVLMLGYMNKEALVETIKTQKVTFYSRSKARLWTKGETSGNWLDYVSAEMDCDADTILVQANPRGPVCHTGSRTCFNDKIVSNLAFLDQLSVIISKRRNAMPSNSYIAGLFQNGTPRIAQKVGEEGVELALAAMKNNSEEIKNEAADLIFHTMVLLEDAKISFSDVISTLENRQNKGTG